MSRSIRLISCLRLLTLVLAFGLPFGSAVAATYYIDSQSGNDANNGLSPGAAWRSLNKANGSVRGVGDDVLLRAGRVFENQSLSVGWSGSETNWVNIGCYNVDSAGKAINCSPADVKPEINGSFEVACAAARTCVVDRSGAVPSTMWTALISVNANYVSVRDINLKDSAGAAATFESTDITRRHHFMMENVVASHLFQAIVLVGNYYQNGVIRNVTASNYGLCTFYKYTECNFGGWHGGIVIHDSPRAMVLVENNTVHNGFGEGFNCLRSSHVLFRGNRVGNVHSNGIYLDHCQNTMVENNIAWGDFTGKWGAYRSFGGVSTANEDYGNGLRLSSINNVVRNNLIAGFGFCIYSEQFPESVKQGLKIGYHYYGNTCAGVHLQNVGLEPASNVDKILVQNNIFYSPGARYGACSFPNKAGIRFESNLWDNGSMTANCRSATDIFQDPGLVSSIDTLVRLDASNMPTARVFSLRADSPVLGRGTNVLTNGVQLISDAQGFDSLVRDPRCQPSASGLPHDYYCVDRRSPPSIGALDRSKYPPRPPVVVSAGG
jgi:Right handed beta helix region